MKKAGLLGIFVLILSLLGLNGCKITDSSDVNPHSIYPIFSVIRQTGEDGIAACAKLRLGGEYGVTVELNNGESLYCNNDLLVKRHGLFDVTYEATVFTAANQYLFRFQPPEAESIDSTVGPLPGMPWITLAADIWEGTNMAVGWDTMHGTGNDILIFVVVDTHGYFSQWNVADNGSYTIPASSLIYLLRYYDPGTYTLRVEVTRRNFYGVNAYFQKGGRGLAESIDVRTIRFHKTSPAMDNDPMQAQSLEKNRAELKALKIDDRFNKSEK